MYTHIVSALLVTGLGSALAAPSLSAHSKPFEHLKGQASNTSAADLQVDLGYSVYQGVSNASIGINYWKGYVSDFDIDFDIAKTGFLS